MAGSAAMSDQPFHVRSISMPSRSHPLAIRVEEELNELRIRQASSTSSSTPQLMCDGLKALGNLYYSVDELLQLPRNQKALTHPQQRKIVEAELDRSIRLLDLCSALRDNLVITKQHIQELQSTLRRNGVAIGSKVHAYIRLRKKADNEIKDCLGSLKKMSTKSGFHLISGEECNDLLLINRVLIEAMKITLPLLQSILSFLVVSRPGQMISRWTFGSKVLQKRRVVCKPKHKNDNGDESLALILHTSYKCLSNKPIDDGRVQKAQCQLQTLEGSTEGLETGLECLFRRLVHNRVSLLNTLSL